MMTDDEWTRACEPIEAQRAAVRLFWDRIYDGSPVERERLEHDLAYVFPLPPQPKPNREVVLKGTRYRASDDPAHPEYCYGDSQWMQCSLSYDDIQSQNEAIERELDQRWAVCRLGDPEM